MTSSGAASSPRRTSTSAGSTGPTSPSAPPASTPTCCPTARPPERGSALLPGAWLDRVRPAQVRGRLAHPDQPRWDATDDCVRRHVVGDDRVRADDRVVADLDAAQDAGSVADPDVRPDHDLALVNPLL